MSTNLKIATPQTADQPDLDLEALAQELWQTIGAIKLANSLSTSLASQTIRALERVRDKRLYLGAKQPTFDAFLDHHPEAPMSHDTFRRRSTLLETEGDAVFDLLSSLRVPMSARKLLAGQVTVNGDEIEIGETRVRIDDRAAVASLFSTLQAELQKQARVNERGKKENERHKRKIDELEDKVSRGGAVSADSTPYARALVSTLGDFQLLTQEVEAIDDAAEQKRFGAVALEHLAQAKLKLEAALGFQKPNIDLGLTAEDEEELLDAQD